MFPRLEREIDGVEGREAVMAVLEDPAFTEFRNINVLPLIYDESRQRCNILVFDYQRAQDQTVRIVKETAGGRRKHPVHRFYDASGGYICEVRYGGRGRQCLAAGPVDSYEKRFEVLRQHHRRLDRLLAQPGSGEAVFAGSRILGNRACGGARDSPARHRSDEDALWIE